jgi:hypothetical protein
MLTTIRSRTFFFLVWCQRNLKIRLYTTIILSLVLYGCGTWSLILRKEHQLKEFENRMLRRIFGPKKDEVRAGWKKLHNEELQDLYSSPSIIRIIKSKKMRCGGHVARIGRRGGAYRLLVRKPEGKRPLGRPRRSWVNNIKMYVGARERGWCVLAGLFYLSIGTGENLF